MRFSVRTVLVVLALAIFSVPAFADHLVGNCPVSLVNGAAASGAFTASPHGLFKNGSVVYALRGQRLLTMNITGTGELQIARDDLMSGLGARETDGAAVYQNGFLFVTGELGLEIFDLRTTKPGGAGTAPTLVSRTSLPHYRRLAVNGNTLAALYPASDMICFPEADQPCGTNRIDIYDISNLNAPVLVSVIDAFNNMFVAWEDIAWTNGYLYATGRGGTYGFDMTNAAAPSTVESIPVNGSFLVTNGTNLLGIGQESLVGVFFVGPGPALSQFQVFTLPAIIDRSNPIMFHQQAWLGDSRLITMIDEKDPATLEPARTIAFDVFDFSVPFIEGVSPRIYENLSFTMPDEVKYNPLLVDDSIYVVGAQSGLQVWGACGTMNGAVEFDTVQSLSCGGAEIHGWVTGPERITRVEVFLDGTSLGLATLTENARTDIPSVTPVLGWRLPVNFDQQARGNATLTVVGTDILGNKRQISSKTLFFNGPGSNCTNRRRGLKRD